jgi:Protein of unknown function (DUF1444)
MKRLSERGPGDMRTFRDHVLELMHREYAELSAKPGLDDGSISVGEWTVNLENIYSTVRLVAAKDRDAQILDFLSRIVESQQQSFADRDLSWAEAKDLLRPRLTPSQYFDPAPDVLRRPFAPGVVVAYAIDHEREVSFSQGSDLERWKVELQRVHDTAVGNLETLSEELELEVIQARGGGAFAVIDTNDSYDAARLVLPRFRARLLAVLSVPVFVGIPNRDFLVAWSADSAQFANHVAQVVKDFGEQPYPITDTIFRIDHSGVRPSTATERGGVVR